MACSTIRDRRRATFHVINRRQRNVAFGVLLTGYAISALLTLAHGVDDRAPETGSLDPFGLGSGPEPSNVGIGYWVIERASRGLPAVLRLATLRSRLIGPPLQATQTSVSSCYPPGATGQSR